MGQRLGSKTGRPSFNWAQGISGLRIIPYSTRRKDESDVATIEIDQYDEKSSVVRKLVSNIFSTF